MGGSHAPDFASASAALAYVSGLDIAVGNGDTIAYKAPLYSLKRNVEGNYKTGHPNVQELQHNSWYKR